MPGRVDLYNSAYANYEAEVYREVRLETYGIDLGQTSWVTTEESEEIPRALELSNESYVLEIGCGSGRYALQLAKTIECRVLGIDVNGPGISLAKQRAVSEKMSAQLSFELCDASEKFPFSDATFDAVFSNDVFCHLPARLDTLREVFRVLKRGSRMLLSDALIIGGTISHEEIATRSSIGYYIFSPPGENERMIQEAGFRLLGVTDTTQNTARIASRWFAAREKRRERLTAIEHKENFDGLQKFLAVVQELASEGRLKRCVYLAEKPGGR